MPNNTVRIRTTPNGTDKYLKVKLEQDFDFIEVLSLKISQEDAYRNFCSDYGVVTGRVIINSGFGVPNARVSIFIPIDDVDKNDPHIKGLYPYEIITDKDSDGIRYNLLPRTSETDNNCFTPVGTFPNKREILDNPEMLDIYCKYYKFTTTTNHAGDFMIFGVPVGTYTIHVDADISDIGIVSQRPYDSISQGTPLKFFESPTKYKGGTNLDKLIQVKSANAGVNVQPFWGNTDTCEIGITRVDLDLNYNIRPCAIFMGSIFGDQDKNSVNKNCIPRRDMGKLCDQVANEGTIEMIRETLDGTIEKFDIEGGRVIDQNGAWAYQVPMNLDYMVTDEFGDLVLSDDPNKGVPTRTSVRFKIGMDQTGGEGRLRTRAKYLVPNNPNNKNEIDYEFGEKTKKTSFRNLYWNKIYSISNFISRFQQITPLQGGGVHTRNMMGIKDVDACAGDKTPFPFNRVATQTSPIFFIICLIIKIIGFMIYIINVLLIPLINLVFSIINIFIRAWDSLVDALCRVCRRRVLGVRIFGFLCFTCRLHIPEIEYIPCIYVRCPADENPAIYAPGCKRGGLDSGGSFDALVAQGSEPTYYDGDNFGHGGFGDLCGLDDCIAFQMAQRMNLFEFDFYNDWINGTLYAFLLKYKKKRKQKELFCEYDCDDFAGDPNATTVDGNNNGVPDNDCRTNHLMDVCFDGGGENQQYSSNESGGIREGIIKKIGDEFIYAASTHDGNLKLFATDIINLGAVFSCDWQGVPKVQPFLIPSSYKIPPANQEVASDYTTVLTTGQCDVDGNTVGLFFSINCLGLHVDGRQCLNIRHLCEYGVELDEFRGVGNETDGIIGLRDLDLDDEDRPKWFRDVFLGLNSTTNSWNLTLPYTSNFNLNNLPNYDFTDPSQNGSDYVNFRGYSLNGNSANGDMFGQPKHSYYFYFGILPGKTGLEVMNQRFFTPCFPKADLEFVIQVTTTPTSTTGATDGTATFTFIGGDAPFTATISGPNGYTNVVTVGQNNTQPTGTITGLAIGVYTITGSDANGQPVIQSFTISGPPALFADAYVSHDCTTAAASNGQITINTVGGGQGTTYTYTLYDSNCGVVSGPTTFTSVPLTINNLQVDLGANTCYTPTGHGYTLVVHDSANGQAVVNNLIVNGATPVILTPTVTQILCYGATTGSIHVAVTGGQMPYSANTTTPNGFTSSALIMNNLSAGTYTTEVVDGLGTHAYTTNTLVYMNPFMEIQAAQPQVLLQQCDPNNYHIKLFVTSPWAVGSTVYLDYSLDGAQDANGAPIWVATTLNGYVNSTTPLELVLPSTLFQDEIIIRMTNAAKTCHSEEITISGDEIRLPVTTLSINTTGVDNTKQCVPNQVKFKFNISHLVAGSTARVPYAVTYTVKGINGLGQLTSTTQYTVVNGNQQEITANVPMPSGLPASSCIVTVTVTDNVLCTSNTIQIPITLPTSQLSGAWGISGAPYQFNGQTYVHKILGASGGIGPYSASPYQIYNGNPNNIYNYPQSVTLASTVTDSVGCSIVVNG